MAKVSIPNSYFVKSRQEYTDWTYAWWREAFQNSIDAGATTISATLTANIEANNITIEFADNGSGMTEEIVVNSLLQMGGSFKLDGSAGGFGYAKTLLFFANDDYLIHTNDILVAGQGGDYTLTKLTTTFRGTSIKVNISAVGWSARQLLSMFRAAFYNFTNNFDNHILDRDIAITFNGQLVTLFEENLALDFYRADTAIGQLYFTDDFECVDRRTTLWVCIKGMPMFSLSSHADKPILGYLEIDGKSTDVLTSNRDNLLPAVSRQVENVLTQIVHQGSALKAKPSLDFMINNQHGEHEITYHSGNAPTNGFLLTSPFEEDAVAARAKMESKLDKWLNGIDTTRYPENFRFIVEGDQEADAYKFAKSAQASRFAYTWKSAVCCVLESLIGMDTFYRGMRLEMVTQRDKDWHEGPSYFTIGGLIVSYGFVFRPSIEALYMRTATHINLLVNPTNFRLDSQDGDWFGGDMLDRAIHEVAHAWEAYHNETFIGITDHLRENVRRQYGELDVEELGKEMYLAAKRAK